MQKHKACIFCDPESVISTMPRLQENIISCVAAFTQDAAAEALGCKELRRESILRMKEQYEVRRNVFSAGINGTGKLSVRRPRGAFYLFVNTSRSGIDDVAFCEQLLEKENALASPGSAFGNMGRNYVRFSYAASMNDIEEAVRRIQHFVANM